MVLTEHDSEKPLEQGEDNCSVYMDKVKNAFYLDLHVWYEI